MCTTDSSMCTTEIHPINDEKVISSLVPDGYCGQTDKNVAEGKLLQWLCNNNKKKTIKESERAISDV